MLLYFRLPAADRQLVQHAAAGSVTAQLGQPCGLLGAKEPYMLYQQRMQTRWVVRHVTTCPSTMEAGGTMRLQPSLSRHLHSASSAHHSTVLFGEPIYVCPLSGVPFGSWRRSCDLVLSTREPPQRICLLRKSTWVHHCPGRCAARACQFGNVLQYKDIKLLSLHWHAFMTLLAMRPLHVVKEVQGKGVLLPLMSLHSMIAFMIGSCLAPGLLTLLLGDSSMPYLHPSM